MAKEDNTLTCIVLIIGIILFVMYINNQKVIELMAMVRTL